MRRLALARLGPVALLAVFLLAAACSTTANITSRAIVTAVPWSVPEMTKYRVLDRNDDEVGTADFEIKAAATGQVRLTQHYDFPGKGFVNDSQVVADAKTLQPASSRYELDGPDGKITCQGDYATGKLNAHREGADGPREDTLDVPDIAYDSWSDLFLWRTVDFSEGFETDYADILSCTLDQTQKQKVALRVTAKESITTPLGRYETWHLEIESGGGTQDAWYTTGAKHTLVKYDNGEQTFELIELP